MTRTFENLSVLVIAWRRADKCRSLLEVLQASGVTDVFVSVDGPRQNHLADKIQVESTIEAVEDFRNAFNLQTRFLSTNRGLRGAMTSAVSWFLSHRDEGLVLEDDILPSRGLLTFVTANLAKFRDIQLVTQISASSHLPPELSRPGSSYFSRFHHVWGFATWSDRWSAYEGFLDSAENVSAEELERCMPGYARSFYRHWSARINRELNGQTETWASSWNGFNFMGGGLSLTPLSSLAINRGFDDFASNSIRVPLLAGFPPQSQRLNRAVIDTPPRVVATDAFDRYVALTQWPTETWSTRMILAGLELLRRVLHPYSRRVFRAATRGTSRDFPSSYLTVSQVLAFRRVFGRWPMWRH